VAGNANKIGAPASLGQQDTHLLVWRASCHPLIQRFRPEALLGIKLEALTGRDVVVPNWITELRERVAATAAK